MKAFRVKINGKYFDYRVGRQIDLEKFSQHLNSKNYRVYNLWQEKRHAVGILEKDKNKYFVKLSTSEGINRTTENEYLWNEKFNVENPRNKSKYWVPKNIESDTFDNLFYFITDYLEGKMLSDKPNPGHEISNLNTHIDSLIDFSELIQKLDIYNLEPNSQFENKSHIKRQAIKTKMWLHDIPEDVVKKYNLKELYKLTTIKNLKKVPRHGDFTIWHVFYLKNGKYLLIDGEHAISNAIEYYDIAYLIQRVYSVLENKKLASDILKKLIERKYDIKKLQAILASRAIGGFLDKTLHENPNYKIDEEFKDFVLDLN